MSKRRSVEERFWRHVIPEPNSGCWLWDGHTDRKGYGRIGLGGRQGGTTGAHRISLRIAGIDVPADKAVCHRCDIPCCVNPEHLFVGTQADNIADMIGKGRRVSGTHKLKGKPRPGVIFNAIKTHCKHGHPLSGDNLSVAPNGWRRCRACWRRRREKSITRDRAGRLSLREATQ
jgi:hypothetical protein